MTALDSVLLSTLNVSKITNSLGPLQEHDIVISGRILPPPPVWGNTGPPAWGAPVVPERSEFFFRINGDDIRDEYDISFCAPLWVDGNLLVPFDLMIDFLQKWLSLACIIDLTVKFKLFEWRQSSVVAVLDRICRFGHKLLRTELYAEDDVIVEVVTAYQRAGLGNNLTVTVDTALSNSIFTRCRSLIFTVPVSRTICAALLRFCAQAQTMTFSEVKDEKTEVADGDLLGKITDAQFTLPNLQELIVLKSSNDISVVFCPFVMPIINELSIPLSGATLDTVVRLELLLARRSSLRRMDRIKLHGPDANASIVVPLLRAMTKFDWGPQPQHIHEFYIYSGQLPRSLVLRFPLAWALYKLGLKTELNDLLQSRFGWAGRVHNGRVGWRD